MEIAEPVMVTLKFPVTEGKVVDANGEMLPVSRMEFNVHTPDKVTLWLNVERPGGGVVEEVRMVQYRVAP